MLMVGTVHESYYMEIVAHEIDYCAAVPNDIDAYYAPSCLGALWKIPGNVNTIGMERPAMDSVIACVVTIVAKEGCKLSPLMEASTGYDFTTPCFE